MVRLERFSLPNILSGEELIEEFIQDEARPQAISEAFFERLIKRRIRDGLGFLMRFAPTSQSRLKRGCPCDMRVN